MKHALDSAIAKLLDTPTALEVYLSEDQSILNILRVLPPEKNLYQTFLELKKIFFQERDKHIEEIVKLFPDFMEPEAFRALLSKKLNDEFRLPLNDDIEMTISDFIEHETELTIENISHAINDCLEALSTEQTISPNGWVLRGLSPLHIFVIEDEIERVARAVHEGNPIDAINTKNKKTPLFYAVEAQNVTTFEWLITNGANPALLDGNQNSILHYVAAQNNAEMLNAIVKLFYNHEQALLIVIEQFPHLTSFFEQFHQMLNGMLFTKYQLGQFILGIKNIPAPFDEKVLTEFCLQWLDKNNLNLFKENKRYNSPLFNAICFDDCSILNYFLLFISDLNITNSSGWNSLTHAIINGRTAALQQLLNHCVRHNLKNIASPDLIPFAIFNDDPNVLAMLISYGAKIPEDIFYFLNKPEAKFSFEELQKIRDEVIEKHCQHLTVKLMAKCLTQFNVSSPSKQEESLFYYHYKSHINSLIDIFRHYFNAPENYFLVNAQIDSCADYLSTVILRQSKIDTFSRLICGNFINAHLKDWQHENLGHQGQLNAETSVFKLRTGRRICN